MDNRTERIITCSCSCLDHAVRVSTFEPLPEDVDEEPQAYIEVMLTPERSFWRRLKQAVLFLFTKNCRYGVASEIIVAPEEAMLIATDLLTYHNKYRKWEEQHNLLRQMRIVPLAGKMPSQWRDTMKDIIVEAHKEGADAIAELEAFVKHWRAVRQINEEQVKTGGERQ
jgi:hypothetical protein